MYANEEGLKNENIKVESLRKVKIWKSKVINDLAKLIRNNKFIIATLVAYILFSAVNAMMICTFFKIMQTIN